LDSLHFTEARRKQASNYEAGLVIVFRCKTTSFDRGEHLVVQCVVGKSLLVRHADGRIRRLRPARLAKHFSVFTQRKTGVSPGDALLILENGYGLGRGRITNGEIVTVGAINASGCIFLKDGRIIPPGFRHFTLGYAITSQRAQGKTVDHVFIAIDSGFAYCATTRETFYVAASRGRRRCSIYTDDENLLRDAFCRSGERMSALELFGLTPRPRKSSNAVLRISQTRPDLTYVKARAHDRQHQVHAQPTA